jgi:tetratricopeptide (TPR) repeat protein
MRLSVGSLQDVFDLQDRVTSRVAGAIAPRLEAAEIERAKGKPTASLDAYDHFLRGMAGLHKWTRDGNEEALAQVYHAIEIDTNYAAAYGMAARTYVQRNSGGWMTDRAREVMEAEKLARRAIALGHDDAVALCTAGFALADICGEIPDGDAFIDRSIEINPNVAWAWLYSGWVKASLGEPELALARLKRARELSPLDPRVSAFGPPWRLPTSSRADMRRRSPRRRPPSATGRIFFCRISLQHHVPPLAGNLGRAKKAMARVRVIAPTLCLSNVHTVQAMRPEDFARWSDGLRIAELPE